MDRHIELTAQHDELLDGRRPLEVGRHEHHTAAAGEDLLGELGRRGRLARPLEATEHQDCGPACFEVERMIHRPHQVDQFAVDDADELLGRVERFEHPLADRIFADPLQELLGDVIGHVGLEQGCPNVGEPLPHVGGREFAAAAERVEGGGEGGSQRFKHGGCRGLTDCGTSLPPHDAAAIDRVNPWLVARSIEWGKARDGFSRGPRRSPAV